MAGRSLTPIGMFAKWVLAPVVLAVGGYFLLGPRMGKILPSLSRSAPAITATPVADSTPSFSAPDVDVQSARKLQAPDVEISATKRHRRHRLHPVEPVNDNSREPVDAYSPPSQKSKPHRAIGTADGI